MREFGDTSDRWLERLCEEQPDAPAIRSFDREPLSYIALLRQIRSSVEDLRSRGIGRGDRVAVVLPKGPSMATACLAVAAGATCVPLNPDYTESEFECFFASLGIRYLLSSEVTPVAARQAAERAALPVFTTLLPSDAATGAFTLSPPSPRPGGALPPESGSSTPSNDGPALLDDIAYVLHTSGSTSKPKIVPLTHRSLLRSAANVADSLALGARDRCLHMLPLFHVGGLVDLLLAPLSRGGEVVCTERTSSKVFFEALDRFEPTWYQGVPTMLHDVAEGARLRGRYGRPNSLRFIRSVSAALCTAVFEEVEASLATPVIEIYGMTETAGLIASNPLPPAKRKPGSVGLAAGPEISIVDGAGNPVGPDESGEVLVRGNTVMPGYEGDATEQAQSFIGSWLRTGDEGHLDAEGYLFLTGRLKEIINRGGEKISPREIDEIAMRHPAVAEAAAFALPHETLGEEVALAVVARPGRALDEKELIAYLGQRLAYFKVPRVMFARDELPRGGSGKLQRHRLAEEFGHGAALTDRPEWIAPRSELARRIAEMWERTLGVPEIGLLDNFFDLGGDSLKAATFIGELEERFDRPIQVWALFEAPTLGEFEAHLCEAETGAGTSAEAAAGHTPEGIRPGLYRAVAGYLAAWRGRRMRKGSLLVGRNTLGANTPLFWGLQAFGEFEILASHLDPNQPLYGFRSLFGSEEKSADSNREIAAYYAREIREIRPQGPYLLGGFCEAAKIAFEIARILRADGAEVALLGLQEQFVPEPYDGRVAFFFCQPGNHSPYQYYRHPERGWPKFYTGQIELFRSKDSHDDYYAERGIQAFAAQLTEAIEDAHSHRSRSPLERESELQRLPPAAYRASIEARVPRSLGRGERRTLCVEIENQSPVTWQPTESSGILLANRWIHRKGKRKVWLDGWTALPKPLAPGERIQLELAIEAPDRGWRWTLEIDLVDEGVTWFGDRGSRAALESLWLSDWLSRRQRR